MALEKPETNPLALHGWLQHDLASKLAVASGTSLGALVPILFLGVPYYDEIIVQLLWGALIPILFWGLLIIVI